MDRLQYLKLKRMVAAAGYADEINWARSLKPCGDPWNFAVEAIWVIINSGMKNQVAREIEQRVYNAIDRGEPISTAFGHKAKIKAIEYIISRCERLFREYLEAWDKLAYLEGLPWIGKITKYHLAKNLGLNVVKPDRHLTRIAGKEGKTPFELCNQLSLQTGDRLAVIDTILWRAANLGFI